MAVPSKQVIERAEEKGWTHLEGPWFKRGESYYVYDPNSETMVIAQEGAYLSREEEAQESGVPKAGPPQKKKETPEPVEVEIVAPTDAETALAIDLADEKQIIQEIEGRIIDQYVYSFKKGNREIIGLSYSGVKWVAREMAKRGESIDIEELTKEEDETHWTVTAKVTNRKTEEHRFGVARQAKVMTFKDGSTKPDDYALTKAVSKAQRNALRAFEPEEIIIEMVREWRKTRDKRERF